MIDLKKFSKTKIVCTIGPATESRRDIERLVRAGMDAARLNFSHGTYEEHRDKLEYVRKAAKKLGREVAVIQDLAGPKIRVGEIPEPGIKVRTGDTVVLCGGKCGDHDVVPVNYGRLANDVGQGDAILMADGTIELKVRSVEGGLVKCKVIVGGTIGSHKGVNIPSEALSIHGLTKKDKKDLEFAVNEDVDFVALSFVRSEKDVVELKKYLKKKGREIPVIAKIERPEAVNNIDGILDKSDGIMVARGDLGVEIPLERVPLVQKMLIRKCNAAGKPVITATQMLRSMVESNRPTRAEVADVANAVWDGTDSVMLSEETATGRYPVEAVKVMNRVCSTVEEDMATGSPRKDAFPTEDAIPDSISYSAYFMAEEMETRAIVTPTRSGATACRVSRYRPDPVIFALTPSVKTQRMLCLTWGVVPVLTPEIGNEDDITAMALEWAKKEMKAKKGDRIIITAGASYEAGTTNTIRLESL